MLVQLATKSGDLSAWQCDRFGVSLWLLCFRTFPFALIISYFYTSDFLCLTRMELEFREATAQVKSCLDEVVSDLAEMHKFELEVNI